MVVPSKPLSCGLSELLATKRSAEEVRKELRIAARLALVRTKQRFVLFTEFWRAFCIVYAMIRYRSFCVGRRIIVALVYGTLHIQTSVARALGSAAFGGAAGFLFVNTGSLLSPLAMGLIVRELTSISQASVSSFERIARTGNSPSGVRYSSHVRLVVQSFAFQKFTGQ